MADEFPQLDVEDDEEGGYEANELGPGDVMQQRFEHTTPSPTREIV
jgi:hypothetical protein